MVAFKCVLQIERFIRATAIIVIYYTKIITSIPSIQRYRLPSLYRLFVERKSFNPVKGTNRTKKSDRNVSHGRVLLLVLLHQEISKYATIITSVYN